jgi:hypothetical protein
MAHMHDDPVGYFSHKQILAACATGRLPASAAVQWLEQTADMRFFVAPRLWSSRQLVGAVVRPLDAQLRTRLVMGALAATSMNLLTVTEPLLTLMHYEARNLTTSQLLKWAGTVDRATRNALLQHYFLTDNPPLVTRLLTEAPLAQRAHFLGRVVDANPSILARLELERAEVVCCVCKMHPVPYQKLLEDSAFWHHYGDVVLERGADDVTLAAAVTENALFVVRALVARSPSMAAFHAAFRAAVHLDRPSALAELLANPAAHTAGAGWVLTLAATAGSVAVVQVLLDHRVDEPIALEWAVLARRHEVARAMLANTRFRARAPIDAALTRAIELDDTEMVALLLSAGTNVLGKLIPIDTFLPLSEDTAELLSSAAALEALVAPPCDMSADDIRWCDEVLSRSCD